MDNVVELRKNSPQKCRESVENFNKVLTQVTATVQGNVEAGKALNIPSVIEPAQRGLKVLTELLIPAAEQLCGKEDSVDTDKATMALCAATLDEMVKQTGVTE